MKTVRPAFTLIELLVVIARIAILAVILFLVVGHVPESTRQISRLSDAKQIATANYIYLQDYDETILPSTNYAVSRDDPHRIWTTVNHAYVKNTQIFFCPSNTNAQFATDWFSSDSLPIG